MTAEELLDFVKRCVEQNRVRLSRHVLEDVMPARRIHASDLTAALRTATGAEHQPENHTWKVGGGRDLDGDPLVVVVVVEGDMIRIKVVTAF